MADEVIPTADGRCSGLSPYIVDFPLTADLEVSQPRINLAHGQVTALGRPRPTIWAPYPLTARLDWVNTTRNTRGSVTTTGQVTGFAQSGLIAFTPSSKVVTGIGVVDFTATFTPHGPVPVGSIRCVTRSNVL
ncbi:hypothetical protein [Williamsia sp. M5A3_1d]